MKRALSPTLLCTSITAAVLAQSSGMPPSPSVPPHPYSVGVAALYGQSPYTGVDDRFLVIPALRFRGERLELEGPRASYVVWSEGPLRLAAVLRWDFAGFDTEDSAAFDGFKKRRDSLLMGVRGTAPLAAGIRLFGEIVTDTLSRHDGQVARIGVNRSFRFDDNRLMITPTIELEGLSSRYGNYYFGVPADLAREDRPFHRVGPTLQAQAGVQSLWLFKERWSLLLGLRLTRLANEIVASPLVDDRVGISALSAVSWSF